MTITQGTFSFLPPLTDDELEAQVRYSIERRCAFGVEHTNDPHPRNPYWEMWELPLFDVSNPATVTRVVAACRAAFPDHFIKLNAYDASRHRRSLRMSIVVHRPYPEPELRLERQEHSDRRLRYVLHARRPRSRGA